MATVLLRGDNIQESKEVLANSADAQRSIWRRVLMVLGRVLFSLAVGFMAIFVVGVIGLPFLKGCPPSETGIGILFCFKPAPWVEPVQAVASIVAIAWAWWISGLITKRRAG